MVILLEQRERNRGTKRDKEKEGRGVGNAVRAGRSFTFCRALKEKEMVIFMDKGGKSEIKKQ